MKEFSYALNKAKLKLVQMDTGLIDNNKIISLGLSAGIKSSAMSL